MCKNNQKDKGNLILKNLLYQAIRFIGLSGIGWVLDFTCYSILSFVIGDPFISNVISSCIGATFVFIFSTRFIFRQNTHVPLVIKYVVYILYQLLLIYLISKLLSWVNTLLVLHFTWFIVLKFAALISKIIVTPITMTLNFFVMKGVMEKL